MKVTRTSLSGVLLLEPHVFSDARGFFFESFNARVFSEATGVNAVFVQDNHSRSGKDTLRGLHYQVNKPQGKLVRPVIGEIFDVVVDLRKCSQTFGQWLGIRLNAEKHHQLWVPEGFAHGFLVLSPVAEVIYKTTDYWAPEYERTLIWNDPQINITWPLQREPVLSGKDRAGHYFRDAEVFQEYAGDRQG